MKRHVTVVVACAATTLFAVTACAPGSAPNAPAGTSAAPSGVKTDPAGMGQVTLTVWDQEVRGGGKAQVDRLNAQFQAKYPNITIKRTSKSFDDLVKTVRLGLSGANAPDVVQINNTRADMGSYVAKKQLVALDPWMQAYGWDKRYPASIRAVTSYSEDGKVFGEGNLYGLPQVGEVVGVYVNTKKLAALGVPMPKTWADFTAALATAKAKNEVPLVLGNVDKWPAVHVFGVVQGQFVKAADIRTLGFGNKGASWKTPENAKAFSTLAEWADKGYFSPGFNGQGYDPAWQAFGKGTGVFLIAGTWLQADLSKALGSDVTFMLPPPNESGQVVTTGASGQPWTITASSKNPDAAAAYINFLTTPEAMKIIAETENLPVVDTGQQKAPNKLGQDVFSAFDQVTTKDGLVPYLDWATPTMSDTIGAALQDLLAKKATPEQTADTLEKDYAAFVAKNG
ncbi:MAG: extracellular solute-binding protein [Austwickia sp.]|nr:extracellular solute-binding protein [Austwickia sp.]MBK9102549.1 extracellular solute-binding protein [Austwickia sp.]